jgi:hypothetical protein
MKEKFTSKDFLYDKTEYYYENEGDHIRAFIDENKDRRLDQLFALYNQLSGEAPHADPLERQDREKDRKMEIEVTRQFIANELQLTSFDHIWYLIDMIEEFRQTVVDKVEKLDTRFYNHRHSRDKTYSEKPSW